MYAARGGGMGSGMEYSEGKIFSGAGLGIEICSKVEYEKRKRRDFRLSVSPRRVIFYVNGKVSPGKILQQGAEQ